METKIYDSDRVWLVDALIESGYSGGPAVFVNGDGRRQVFGIVKSIKSTSDLYSVEDAAMNEVEGLFYRRQSGIVEVVSLSCLNGSGILQTVDAPRYGWRSITSYLATSSVKKSLDELVQDHRTSQLYVRTVVFAISRP